MNNLVFNILERNEKGEKSRKNGYIPCIIYGDDPNKSLSAKLNKKEMVRLLSYPKSSVISLNINGKLKRCIVKEMQKNVFGKIIHIDFQSINKGDLVKLKIPIIFSGQGMLEVKGLLLESFITEIDLQGEPGKFPDNINIDVSNFEQGSQIFVRDLDISDEIILETNKDLAIAKIGYNSNKLYTDII